MDALRITRFLCLICVGLAAVKALSEFALETGFYNSIELCNAQNVKSRNMLTMIP